MTVPNLLPPIIQPLSGADIIMISQAPTSGGNPVLVQAPISSLPPGNISGLLPTTGGTMTGAIVLAGDPTLALHPATKQYSDAAVATRAMHAATVSALRAITPTGSSATCMVEGYTTPGDNGGGRFVWSATSTATDDGLLVFMPTGLVGAGRWLRVVADGILIPEMAGGAGDYQFPRGGVGENLGTDNTSAIQNVLYAASWNGALGGCTVRLLPGKKYRIAGVVNVPTGSKITGEGFSAFNYITNSNGAFAQLMGVGSVLVLNPSAVFQLDGPCRIENIRIMRQGLDQNPTTAQVIALWNTVGNELCGGKMWLPATAYTAGNVVVNNSNVYVCDTSGTSGAFATGGPQSMSTATNNIVDGTAKWHWLNQLGWTGNTAFAAGTLVASGNSIYQCDTAGTSASYPPLSGSTTGVNSLTDGTAKWHLVQNFSTGIYAAALATICDCTIIGFAKGILALTGASEIRNVYMENFCNLDISGTGDTNVIENVKCIPIYLPTADVPPNQNYWRKPWCSFDLHDHTDTLIVNDCESEAWAVGFRISNVWSINVSRCRCETLSIASGDACFKFRNTLTFCEFTDNHMSGVICYDIGAVDHTNASTPSNQASTVESMLGIHGGYVAPFYGFVGSTPFLISGNARGTISGVQVNVQGMTTFTFLPGSGPTGSIFWKITNIRLDEDTYPQTWNVFQSMDASVAAYVHYSDVWDSAQNRPVALPGRDDTIDLVSSPLTSGSHAVADFTSWCHLTPAGTLATYTVTMPPNPGDKQELLISSTAALTALTVSPNSGQTIDAAPTTLAAHGAVRFKYLAATTQWVRLIMA